MATFDITTGVQSPSGTGAVTGTLDTSAMSGDFSINLRITALDAGKSAVVTVEDTASASAFSDAHTLLTYSIAGPVYPASEIVVAVRASEIPNGSAVLNDARLTLGSQTPRYGVANSALRAKITSLSGSANLSLHAWIAK